MAEKTQEGFMNGNKHGAKMGKRLSIHHHITSIMQILPTFRVSVW